MLEQNGLIIEGLFKIWAVSQAEIKPSPKLKWPFEPDYQKSAFLVMVLNILIHNLVQSLKS